MNLGPWSCDKKEVMIVWKEMMLGSWTRIVWKEECMTVCMKKSSRTLVASSNFWLVHFGISQFSAPVFSSKRERSCSCVCGAMPKKEVNFATSWQKWCSALISYICIHLRKANRLIPRAVALFYPIKRPVLLRPTPGSGDSTTRKICSATPSIRSSGQGPSQGPRGRPSSRNSHFITISRSALQTIFSEYLKIGKKKKADQKRPFEKKCFFFQKNARKTPLRTSCIGFSCLHIV